MLWSATITQHVPVLCKVKKIIEIIRLIINAHVSVLSVGPMARQGCGISGADMGPGPRAGWETPREAWKGQ